MRGPIGLTKSLGILHLILLIHLEATVLIKEEGTDDHAATIDATEVSKAML